MQVLTNHGESAAPMMPPATGGLFYYPGQWRGRFPSVRAALASIGCTGDAADAQVRNASVNASPSVAVPVKVQRYPADMRDGDLVAVIVRKPGGKADLWLGIIGLADSDRDAVLEAVRQFSEASGGKWAVFEWARQAEVLQ